MRLLLLAALLALARASVLDQENQNGTSSSPTQPDVLPSPITVPSFPATISIGELNQVLFTFNTISENINPSNSGEVKTNDTGSSLEQTEAVREDTNSSTSMLLPGNYTQAGRSSSNAMSGLPEDHNGLSQRGGVDCPSQWDLLSTGCYRFITSAVNWYQARDRCTGYGGYLAEIESPEEQNELVAHFQGFSFKRLGYWIGLTDSTEEGSFKWDFSGKTPTFIPWGRGQPDNLINQDCVLMFQGGNTNRDGSWDDDQCHYTGEGANSRGAICEISVSTPSSEPSTTATVSPPTILVGMTPSTPDPTATTTDTNPNDRTSKNASTPVIAAISVLGVLLLCLCLALAIICARRKMGKTVENYTVVEIATSDNTTNLPSHMVLQKDESLKDNAKALAENKDLLNDEFKRVEVHAKTFGKKKTNVGRMEKNMIHNRYTDIVPYDDNYISLTSPQFSPPETSYVNASRIMFEGCPITFIAAQAPRPASFRHFWHMVIQEGVSVIMMITRLVEGKKRKADQYWPDQEQAVVEVGEGSRVELASSSYQGTYHLRRFTLWLPDGGMRQVCQLQTEDWPDLGAPEGPRLLVDLLLRAQDLHREAGPGPMLVHCSAGVGRTGTFMALYKLWLDYQATSCTSLAIMPTVLALREQRCLMVQKEVQYHYIARCLSFMVSCEEGDYYMATGGEADYWAP